MEACVCRASRDLGSSADLIYFLSSSHLSLKVSVRSKTKLTCGAHFLCLGLTQCKYMESIKHSINHNKQTPNSVRISQWIKLKLLPNSRANEFCFVNSTIALIG